MKFATTLDGRLLCASECAYEIGSPYFQGVGFVAGATAKRISRGVNSCLVGRTIDGIVVAFRGTQSGNPFDWLQNSAIYLRKVKALPAGAGRIHAGFYEAVQALFEPLKRLILGAIQDTPLCHSKKVYLAGHSKGGCLASLMAVLMKQDKDLPDAHYVCSFGGARVGDPDFRSYFNRTINQTTYENDLDLVPFLPPGSKIVDGMDTKLTDIVDDIMWSKDERNKAKGYLWDYQPIGHRRYINAKEKIVKTVTTELDSQRIKDIEKKTLLSFAEFRRAHCSACPDNKPDGRCSGGYFCAIAPEICKEAKTFKQ